MLTDVFTHAIKIKCVDYIRVATLITSNLLITFNFNLLVHCI